MADPAPLLQLEAVTKDFGERVVTRVLHGIDLRVDRGEFVALVGPSGSGKSTLLNLIGLLDRPSSGTLRIDGVDTSSMPDEELTRLRGRILGFVFQFHHLLPAFTAIENVLIPWFAQHGRPDAAARARAADLLRRVGLAEKENARVTEMSGGQQQRVAIARALCVRPGLLLADEPTGNLDTRTADEIFAVLRRVHEDEHNAVIIVTHDARMAERCDRIIEIVDGRIVSDRRKTA